MTEEQRIMVKSNAIASGMVSESMLFGSKIKVYADKNLNIVYEIDGNIIEAEFELAKYAKKKLEDSEATHLWVIIITKENGYMGLGGIVKSLSGAMLFTTKKELFAFISKHDYILNDEVVIQRIEKEEVIGGKLWRQ